MSRFSAVNDAMEGFRLIGRRPGAVAVWVLLWMVLALGPMIAGVVMVLPHFIAMISDMRNMDAEGSAVFTKMMQFQAAAWTMLAPWMLWLFVAQTVLNCAIFRAVLEPRSGGLAGVKLGMDEVRQFLLQIILVVLWGVFVSVLVGLGVATFVAASQVPHGMGGWLDALAVILLLCLGVYVPIRLALAAPMTFARKRLDVFGSWRVTRGRFWPLVGMILVLFVFLCVVVFVVGALRNIAVLGFDWRELQGLQNLGDDPRAMLPALMHALTGPGMIVFVVIQGIAQALMRIIAVAPFAAAYRDLSGAPAESAASNYEVAPAHG